MANITGWSRGEWGEAAWNEAVPVRVGHTLNGWGELGFGVTSWGGEQSTIDAMQGQVGVAVVRENVSITVTGLGSVSAVGSVIAKGNNSVSVVGLSGTGNVGTVTLRTEQNIPTTGLEATMAVGSVTVVEGAGVTVTLTASLLGTASVNGVTVVINAYAPATGLEVSGSVGSVTIIEGTGVDVNAVGVEAAGGVTAPTIIGDAPNVQVTGIAATGLVKPVELRTFQRVPVNNIDMVMTAGVGTVEPKGNSILNVTGLSASATVGSVLVYGNITPNPGTSWTPVSPSGGGAWTEEEPEPNTTWTEIAA